MQPEHLLRQQVPRDGSYNTVVSRMAEKRVAISESVGVAEKDVVRRWMRCDMGWNANEVGSNVEDSKNVKRSLTIVEIGGWWLAAWIKVITP